MNLTLDEVLKNMKELKNRYGIKCVMYHRNRGKVGLQTIRPKDLMVTSSRMSNDTILNMLAKEEELISSLDEIKESYNLYRELAINILVDYAMTKSKEEMIIIYRDKMHFKWDDIAWLIGYEERQIRRIYNKEYNKN